MIGVTGATGHLGGLVIDELLERGVRAGEIVAAVRSPEKASGLAERGVQVRQADYEQPRTLGPALEGVDRLLLISSSEVGRRVEQHRNVIQAADAADVTLLAYTSILNADANSAKLAEEHRATEAMIRESGIPSVLLRNGWYMENYTGQLPQYLEHGAIMGSAGDGRISAATRADYAVAAAVVVSTDGHENAVYELGGDDPFTMRELASEISRQSGREVTYHDLPFESLVDALSQAGVPEEYARILADSDRAVAQGNLYTESGSLRRLIGRPTTTMAEAVAAALED